MELVFATHNQNKFEEVLPLMPKHIKLLSLDMINCFDEIEETGATLEENARIKADFVTKNYGYNCFADDTGLLVDVLKGAPGVFSARYAGPKKNADANMDKLLIELKPHKNRDARFQTTIALNLHEQTHIYNGEVLGKIITTKRGSKGFGYDPIFIPESYDKTFAELPLSIKNKISHRGKAINSLIDFLSTL
ncbi:non-canonical purine NTP diphosphatase [Croceitalea sp. MTPC9]|uniref:non-canonical purine NTP diphosphatase n=1 Tax=unclassified Croceitalea TaxID=2632280 RepID=UPI002B3846B3|nr:non-canonical purine NTP diphosphatase [Croceitalea sp. MTPC6]GMN15435.1 non-canonical purine NTP diphosphatase [Croceitalea sp. MTPC9]